MKRRISLILLLVAVAVCSVAAWAIEINGAKRPAAFMASQKYCVLDSSTTLMGLATSYTIYGQDPTDVFYYEAKFDGSWWGFPLTVPAGQSLLVPAPEPEYDSGDGYYRHNVRFTAQADSVLVIRWVK